MFQHIASLLFALLLASSVDAAMLRVVRVVDGRTISVERGGKVENLRLSGIEVADEVQARELLQWTLGTSWVLAESDGRGAWRIWRSPDALFINRELVLRGYARATADGIAPPDTAMVTYLGVVNPSGAARSTAASKAAKAAPAPKSSSGTSRRSKASSRPAAKPPRRSTKDY
jgi:endonuclease YncB( thermonuclease family)